MSERFGQGVSSMRIENQHTEFKREFTQDIKNEVIAFV
jgi:hypothetical protein